MRLFSLTIAVAIASAVSPTLANASEKMTFEHKGSTFIYTVDAKGSATVVKGTAYPGATPFRLRLKNDRVTGYYGSSEVAFKQAEAKGATNTGSASLLSMR